MDLWDHPNLSYMAEKYGHNEKITSEPSSTKGIIISVVILLVLTVAIIWHWEIFCFTYNSNSFCPGGIYILWKNKNSSP